LNGKGVIHLLVEPVETERDGLDRLDHRRSAAGRLCFLWAKTCGCFPEIWCYTYWCCNGTGTSGWCFQERQRGNGRLPNNGVGCRDKWASRRLLSLSKRPRCPFGAAQDRRRQAQATPKRVIQRSRTVRWRAVTCGGRGS